MSTDREKIRLLVDIAETVTLLFQDLKSTDATKQVEITFDQELCAELWDLSEKWQAIKDESPTKKKTAKK